MLLIVGTVRMPLAKVAEAREDMERVIAASRAEPGCVEYSYGEDVLDPGLIHVKEIWQDRAAFEAHGASPHAAAWRARWPAIELTGRSLMAYEVGAPRAV